MQVGHFQLTWTVHIPKPAFMRALLILFLSCYFIHFFFFFSNFISKSIYMQDLLRWNKDQAQPIYIWA